MYSRVQATRIFITNNNFLYILRQSNDGKGYQINFDEIEKQEHQIVCIL